jgi:threonine/homoserine/homoserine lactone efflux protein
VAGAAALTFTSMPIDLYLSFLVAALIVIAAPGPDSLNSLAIGLARGRREGVAYALGVGVGCLTHTLWAMLGISAVVAASGTLFAAIKWVGVVYLLWLGVQSLRSRGSLAALSAGDNHRAHSSAMQRFRQGLFTNALNPKVMLFFLAFLPQFVDPAHGVAVVWQLGLMGLSFTVITALAYCALAAGAGTVGARLTREPRIALWLERATGVVFIAMAARLALADRK